MVCKQEEIIRLTTNLSMGNSAMLAIFASASRPRHKTPSDAEFKHDLRTLTMTDQAIYFSSSVVFQRFSGHRHG